MKGMEALQKTADLTYSNEIPTSVYNPSGMYGLKAMGDYVPEYPQLVTPRPAITRRFSLPVVKKKMVRLAPLKMTPPTPSTGSWPCPSSMVCWIYR